LLLSVALACAPGDPGALVTQWLERSAS
jgi:hypothetical protein